MIKNTENINYWNLLRNDPEIYSQIPEYPRVASNIKIIPYKRGIALLGSGAIEVFDGPAIRLKLSKYLAKLDGSRNLDDLLTSSDVDSIDEFKEILANLFLSGLLRNGKMSAEASNVECYFDRTCGTTGLSDSGAQSCARLNATKCAIYVDRSLTESLDIKIFPGSSTFVSSINDLTNDTDYLLVLNAHNDIATELFTIANKKNITALNIEVESNRLRIGPMFLPRRSASYDCYIKQYKPLSGIANTAEMHFALALSNHQLQSFIGGACKQLHINSFTDYHWSDGRQVSKVCLLSRLHEWDEDGRSIDLPINESTHGYELWKRYCSIALQSIDVTPPNSYHNHYRKKNMQAIYERNPALYTGEYVQLPSEVENMIDMSMNNGIAIDLEKLAYLITICAGYTMRNGLPHRNTATGGNLGSTQLVMAVFDVDGLKPGMYWFDSQNNHLEFIDSINVSEIRDRLDPDCSQSVLLISLSNTPKVARKYGAFSFNISWYDAGVLFSSLVSLCDVCNLVCHDNRLTESESILDILQIANSGFMVTGIYGLSQGTGIKANHHGISNDRLIQLIRNRTAVRSWSTDEINNDCLEEFMTVASKTLRRFNKSAGKHITVSLLLLLKRDNKKDGFYEMSVDGNLKFVKSMPRRLHDRILSQVMLTRAPIIALPNISLTDNIKNYDDLQISESYRACGSIVGDLWLHCQQVNLHGTACGGCIEGEVRSVLNQHGLDRFTPLAICFGPE